METFSSISVNSLTEISFIGGSYKELTFSVYDANGAPLDIRSFTYKWILSPYGEPDTATLIKDGVIDPTSTDHNRFIVYLFSYDTVNSSGKFTQQPIVVGNTGYEYRMAQGYITIIPASSLSTVEDIETTTDQMITFVQDVSGSFVTMEILVNELSGSVANYYSATSASITATNANVTRLSASATALSASATWASASIVNVNTSLSSGWVTDTGTWSYISASAIAVPTDATARFAVGDKIKIIQPSNTKYFYVRQIPSATVLYVAGSTVGNEAVTSASYSKAESPIGFPQYFDYTPTGIAATNVTLTGRYCLKGRTVQASIKATFSNTITFTEHPSLPIPAGASINTAGSIISVCGTLGYYDSGTATVMNTYVPIVFASGSVVRIVSAAAGAAMSNTAPITWAANDILFTDFHYEI